MNSSELNINLVESYFAILKNLSSENKLKLIEKLSTSIEAPIKQNKNSIKSSYGAFVSEKSAEELIEEIRSSRTLNSNREEL